MAKKMTERESKVYAVLEEITRSLGLFGLAAEAVIRELLGRRTGMPACVAEAIAKACGKGLKKIKCEVRRLADGYPHAVYDPEYGDGRLCKCGHPYYRHFDTYENMSPVGCKYCRSDDCEHFKQAPEGEHGKEGDAP